MARHAGGPAPAAPEPVDPYDLDESDSLINAVVNDDAPKPRVQELPLHGVDRERYERLMNRRPKVRNPEVGKVALEAAALFQASRPFVSEAVDRESVSALTQFLVHTHHETGTVDLYRALRRPTVTRYLGTRKSSAPRTVRYYLHSAGRVLHPAEFPTGNGDIMYRGELSAPATVDNIRALREAAPSLSPKWERALQLIVEIVLACGARISELKWMQHNDFRWREFDGHRVLVVSLSTAKTPVRQVPVVDEAQARRVMRLVRDAPHDRLMAFGEASTVERNAVNRVNEKLADRGLSCRVNPYALRNRWMVTQAKTLKLDEFCAVANIIDIRGVRAIMTGPTPSLSHLTKAMWDAQQRDNSRENG